MGPERRHLILLPGIADMNGAVVDELVHMFDQVVALSDLSYCRHGVALRGTFSVSGGESRGS